MPRQCKAELIFAVKHSRQKINSLHGALLHDVSERNLIKSRKTVAFARKPRRNPMERSSRDFLGLIKAMICINRSYWLDAVGALYK